MIDEYVMYDLVRKIVAERVTMATAEAIMHGWRPGDATHAWCQMYEPARKRLQVWESTLLFVLRGGK
jgi:ribosomal protein L19